MVEAKMDPKTEIKTICHAFAWMGLSSVQPYLREKSSIHNILLFVPIIIQIVVVSIEAYLVLSYPSEFFHPTSKMGAFTDVLQVGGILIAGIVQIIENIWKCTLDQRIGYFIAKIDDNIFAQHFCARPPNCSFCRKRSLKAHLMTRTFYLIVVALLVDLIIITTIPNTEKTWRQSIIVREITSNIIRFGILQIDCYFYWVNIFGQKLIPFMNNISAKFRVFFI